MRVAEETLSTELGYATLTKNVADEPTPVAEWDVPEGTKIVLRQGHPAILDVEANGGGDLPRASRLGLAFREPNDPLDAYTVISDVSLAPFNTLSLKDQQSGDNAQRRRVRFDPDRVPGGEITLSDSDTLALILLSGSQIDETSLFFNYPMQVRQE
jgi:hypothetical protein